MKQSLFTIESNKKIARDIFEMKLRGDIREIKAPGQFVNIRVDGFFLRRPISVCDLGDGEMTLIYKTVGGGTKAMSGMERGRVLDILTGLGNGFDTSRSGDTPLLIGGGVGVPPMYLLCKRLAAEGKKPTALLGFGSRDEVFYEDFFAALGARVIVTTADGSYGMKGFVTDAMKELSYSYFYACGPEAMFRAVEKTATASGEYSFEERMGCGFGACMGCSCLTLTGSKRICVEGPVMKREEIIWER